VLSCGLATFSSDMFSLGVVLYSLLSGGLSPFYASTRVKTFIRVLNCQ
jgi:serine/threonine protein kinase